MAQDPSAPGDPPIGGSPPPSGVRPTEPEADPRPAEAQGEGAADPAAEGAPIPQDAVDPELLRLPRPRLRRHPVLALAVVALGGLVLLRLQGDLRYALQPATPVDKGEARALRLDLEPGGFIALRAEPDLRNALHFEARGERARSQLFRVIGSGSRLFVVTPGLDARDDFQPRFAGRLRRFDDLPYAESVRAYYQREAKVLRTLSAERLRQLPPGPLPTPLSTSDRAGEPLSLQADDELLLRVRFPDDVRVLLQRSKFPSEPDARHEVERLGLPAGPAVETKDGYGYVLRLPAEAAARNQALSRIDAQGMLFLGRQELYRVKTGALVVGPDGLRLPGPERLPQPVRYEAQGAQLQPAPRTAEVLLPWADVQAVQRSEPLLVPRDALVLLDGETPAALRWTLPVAALLVLFMAFNLWYLGRGLAERRG